MSSKPLVLRADKLYWRVKVQQRVGCVWHEGWIRFIPAADRHEAMAKAVQMHTARIKEQTIGLIPEQAGPPDMTPPVVMAVEQEQQQSFGLAPVQIRGA